MVWFCYQTGQQRILSQFYICSLC